MSWYKCMTPFQDNIELIIEKHSFLMHCVFPGVDYNSNKQVLSGISM